MARIFPADRPAMKGSAPVGTAERLLFIRLARELDDGWQIIHDCELRGGESCAIAFVLLHRDRGIALLGAAEQGDSELGVAAMRGQLADIGFTRRYRGHVAIVAAVLRQPDTVRDLADFLAARFAALPITTIGDPTWPDWLAQRLVPATLERPGVSPAAAALATHPALRAPAPEESWRVIAADKAQQPGVRRAERSAGAVPGMRIADERIAVSQHTQTRSSLWAGMALAALVVAVVLVGMAVLSHGNGPSGLLSVPPGTGPPMPASTAAASG